MKVWAAGRRPFRGLWVILEEVKSGVIVTLNLQCDEMLVCWSSRGQSKEGSDAVAGARIGGWGIDEGLWVERSPVI